MVEAERIHVDHGLDGHHRERPGLREALAACRAGDTMVVTKLDRLARSLPDARAIADELTCRQISLSLGGSVYDPTDAVGRLLSNVLAMIAEFESDLIRLRTVEGMKVAKAKGRLKGKQPELSRKQGRTPGVPSSQRRRENSSTPRQDADSISLASRNRRSRGTLASVAPHEPTNENLVPIAVRLLGLVIAVTEGGDAPAGAGALGKWQEHGERDPRSPRAHRSAQNSDILSQPSRSAASM